MWENRVAELKALTDECSIKIFEKKQATKAGLNSDKESIVILDILKRLKDGISELEANLETAEQIGRYQQMLSTEIYSRLYLTHFVSYIYSARLKI